MSQNAQRTAPIAHQDAQFKELRVSVGGARNTLKSFSGFSRASANIYRLAENHRQYNAPEVAALEAALKDFKGSTVFVNHQVLHGSQPLMGLPLAMKDPAFAGFLERPEHAQAKQALANITSSRKFSTAMQHWETAFETMGKELPWNIRNLSETQMKSILPHLAKADAPVWNNCTTQNRWRVCWFACATKNLRPTWK